jgi:hypothetical protein
MWELLSEFEIHFKIGHASFNVSLSPVSITSVLSTRYPSNFQCKSPAIILRLHPCRLDLKLDQIWTVPFTFLSSRPLCLTHGAIAHRAMPTALFLGVVPPRASASQNMHLKLINFALTGRPPMVLYLCLKPLT